jgi:acyl carrier protein
MFHAIRRAVFGLNAKERAELILRFTSRQPQTNSECFAECGLADTEENNIIVAETRSQIARLAGLSPEYLHSDDILDAYLRPHAGSDSIDFVELLMALEEQLDHQYADAELQTPMPSGPIAVTDFINAIACLFFPQSGPVTK